MILTGRPILKPYKQNAIVKPIYARNIIMIVRFNRMMIDEIYNCRQACIAVAEVSEEWKKDCELFEKSLSEEQLDIFHKLCDLQSETAGEDMRSAYKAGFEDGLRIAVEILYN